MLVTRKFKTQSIYGLIEWKERKKEIQTEI